MLVVFRYYIFAEGDDVLAVSSPCPAEREKQLKIKNPVNPVNPVEYKTKIKPTGQNYA